LASEPSVAAAHQHRQATGGVVDQEQAELDACQLLVVAGRDGHEVDRTLRCHSAAHQAAHALRHQVAESDAHHPFHV
jgi:hypothetical protein